MLRATVIMDTLKQLKISREYLAGYDNQHNFARLSKAESDTKASLKLAIGLANQPGKSDEAITAYNEARQNLDMIDSLYFAMGSVDQRAYVDDIKDKRIALEYFMDNNLKELDIKMRNSLKKPDPKWAQTEIDNLINNPENNGSDING